MPSPTSAPVDLAHEMAPLSSTWSLVSKVAIALGLVLVVVSAQPRSSTVHTEMYTAPHMVRQVGATTVTHIGTPALRHMPSTLNSMTRAAPAAASSQSSSTKPAEQPNALRGLGWLTLWFGTMAAVGTTLWNRMSSINQETSETEGLDSRQGMATLAAAALSLNLNTMPAMAEVRLPPLDNDPKRCERGFVGNTIGQANAVSDKLLDLRQCDLESQVFDGRTLSGALMVDGKFKGSSFVEAILTKVYAVRADFANANFTSSVLDRGIFDGADMSGANFYNAVITGTTFKGTNLSGASFEDALIGSEDAKRLCANPTLQGESRLEVGCRD